MKESNLSPPEQPTERRTVEIEKLTRQMQYRYEKEQSEPTGAYKAPTKRRTVEL